MQKLEPNTEHIVLMSIEKQHEKVDKQIGENGKWREGRVSSKEKKYNKQLSYIQNAAILWAKEADLHMLNIR